LNEYTRREEIRWTLATVFILVPAVAVAIVRLVLAQGPMVQNPEAIQAEATAKQAEADHKPCSRAAGKLAEEVGLFEQRADNARKKAEKEAAEQRKKATEELVFDIPWTAAAPVLKQAKALELAKCRTLTEAAAGKDEKASLAWVAVRKASKIQDPGAVEKDQQAAAHKLLELFDDAPVEAMKTHATMAGEKLAVNVTQAAERREKDLIRAPLATGLFPRGGAIGVGVGVSLAALIISYISVRSASMRRARTLVSLRRFANTPEAGLQAAAIVRLAAHHNGGEPGMVIGSALGGLLAAVLSPTDNPNVFIADLFVAGSMGGLLIGLAAQWLLRTMTGVGSWRERTKELGDIEKPTIPVALVLGGVTPGLEKQFLRYFEALPVADAATVVQKLAAQAEEQILAAADAAHQQQLANQQMAQQAGAWGPSPGGQIPPHM
jgi:hypothetical protein